MLTEEQIERYSRHIILKERLMARACPHAPLLAMLREMSFDWAKAEAVSTRTSAVRSKPETNDVLFIPVLLYVSRITIIKLQKLWGTTLSHSAYFTQYLQPHAFCLRKHLGLIHREHLPVF